MKEGIGILFMLIGIVYVAWFGLSCVWHELFRPFSKTICVDFDGVLNSYKTGWSGPRKIVDPPVPGAIEWLEYMAHPMSCYRICIYSSRSRFIGGPRAMKKWLCKHGLSRMALGEIDFPIKKPAAFITIDDRAICFNGTFPTIAEIEGFIPWNKIKNAVGPVKS